jgi:hypothetical protein
LGGRSQRTSSKLGILADWAAAYGVSPLSLLILHESGRLVLIFDAFDEMDLVGEASLRLDHFRRLWEFSLDRSAKILLTGRPNFFLDGIERDSALNVRERSNEIPFTESIYLTRFSVDQCALALRNFTGMVKTEVISTLNSQGVAASFADLLSRPSTLFFAAVI